MAGYRIDDAEHAQLHEHTNVSAKFEDENINKDKKLKNKNDLIFIINLNYKWCSEHLDIITAFGRYPHRNKALGRENTEEEDLYLRDA